jgi:putative glutamine amidotransferase
MMQKKPVIGVTPDIEFHPEGRPPRDFYSLDARNFVALRELGACPIILPHEYDNIDRYLDMIDGVMISGGSYQFKDAHKLFNDSKLGAEEIAKYERTRFEWRLIERALERNMAVFGVCGGFQTINAVLGGELIVSLKDVKPEWEKHRAPPYDVASHDVLIKPDTNLRKIVETERISVNSLHKQGVVKVGPGVVPSGVSDDGVVEVIEFPASKFCMGIQWHLEFLISDADRRIFQAFVDSSR